MSEAPSQNTNNPEKFPAQIPSAPEAMQLQNLDTLVGYRDKLLVDLESQGGSVDDNDTVSELLASEAVDYLNRHGYNEDDYSVEENDFAVARLVEVMKQDEDQWTDKNPGDFPAGTPKEDMVPRRNLYYRRLVKHYEANSAQPKEADGGDDTEEDTNQKKEYKPSEETLLDNKSETAAIAIYFAEKIAERSKRSFERSGRTEEITNLREEFAQMINAVATEMMVVLEEQGKTEQQIATEIDKFIGEQTELLAEESEAIRAAEYTKKSPFIQKQLDRWASWGAPGEKFFSKQRFMGSLKKGAVFAVPGIAIGAVAGAVAAPVLGAGVAAGAGVMLARSVGRNILGARLNRAANAKNTAIEMSDEMRGRVTQSEAVDKNPIDFILEGYDQQSEKYRKINRRRLIGGTAIAASAGLISSTLADHIADADIDYSGAARKVGNFFQDKFGGSGVSVSNEGSAPIVGPPAGTETNFVAPAFDIEQAKEAVENSQRIFDYASEHVDATDVTAGEGWSQTFKEFGIPSQHRIELLKEIGPQLKDMGVAYKMEDGLWGISEKGALPDEATHLILSKASEHGWINLGDTAEVAAPKEIIDTYVLEKGHGIVAEAQDFGIDNLSNNDINTLGQALTEEGTGYKSDYLAEQYGNQYGLKLDASPTDGTPSGELTPEARAIFNDFADNRQLDQSAGYEPTEVSGDASSNNVEALNTDTQGAEITVDANKVRDWVDSGDISKLNMMDAKFGNELGESLDGVTYSNGVPVATRNAFTGEWNFNDVPYGLTMPDEAKQKVGDFLSKRAYDLAS